VMAANIEEAAQLAVRPTHYQDGFSCNFGSDVLAGRRDLLCASHRLPGTAENSFALEPGDAFVGVPRAWNCGSLAEWLGGIKAGDSVLK